MKKYLILVLIVLLIGALTVGVLAVGKTGQAGKSNIAHLYLYEKIPDEPADPTVPWVVVEDGAWGKMKYNLSGEEFDFVFNGHGLVPGEVYCLIYFVDVSAGWTAGLPAIFCLGMGEANGGGEVHIAESVNIGMDLPREGDQNYPDGGAKIWLILSESCDANEGDWGFWMNGWNPTEYLFEGDMIEFDDTDD